MIGSRWAGLLTSWHPKMILQNPSVSLSILGHHTFDQNLCFILTIPGCPSCASVRTHGLNLLGITILVPWRFSLPIKRSSLATDYVQLELTIPPASALYTVMQLTEFLYLLLTLLQSRVSSSHGVTVIATNLTNLSDALCTAKGPAWFSACSKLDKEPTMFCFPGKYLTLNL